MTEHQVVHIGNNLLTVMQSLISLKDKDLIFLMISACIALSYHEALSLSQRYLAVAIGTLPVLVALLSLLQHHIVIADAA
jgi:hypothetical protein